ncbi:uncharacterized protein [Lepisosteus oculatus]|uniref:uncharacterized protein n=1 Tax=Lepisosteus oculatus TaxID=7918 RepID=UPI003715BA07
MWKRRELLLGAVAGMRPVLAACLWLGCLGCLSAPGRACGGAHGPAGAGDLLLCRACGHEVALGSDLKFVASGLALAQRNGTAVGGRRVPVQLFQNPHGSRFRVVTLRRAAVRRHWPADGHFSWFPGYSWTVATCPRCHTHLGWGFQPSDWPDRVSDREFEDSEQTFVGLIVDKLLQENFAASLLMTPKTFQS